MERFGDRLQIDERQRAKRKGRAIRVLRPCSQLRSVATLTPIMRANQV